VRALQQSEHIVSYTAEELRAMRERGEIHQPDWAYVDALIEEELEASIDIEEEGEIDWETVIIGMPGPVMQLVFHIDKDILDWY
jgi:hypothetical protein